MKIELHSQEHATLIIVLKKERAEIDSTINNYNIRLNGSDSTEDVRWYTNLIKGQKSKLKSIDNMLNQLKWK
tara:strand:- start:1738 stop:1953 length:216 start_codon:yes stop_codon:yes gene_type:complete